MNILQLFEESLPYLTHYGLILVFAGALVEGETVVLLAGVLVHRGILPFEWTVVVAACGAFVGDQIWFHLGRRFGSVVLLRFPRLMKQADQVRPWIQQRADWIAGGSRFIYGTRTIAPLLLGRHEYPSLRFAWINSISASIWSLAIVTAGYVVGSGVDKLFGRVQHIEQLLLVIVLFMLLRWWYRQHKLSRPDRVGDKDV